jgi:hypothetical protein
MKTITTTTIIICMNVKEDCLAGRPSRWVQGKERVLGSEHGGSIYTHVYVNIA